MARHYTKLMSRYNPGPKQPRHPNLQMIYIPAQTTNKKFKCFAGKKIKACTKCIKTLSKTKKAK